MKIEIQFMVTATIEFCEADLNQETLQECGQQKAIEEWVADNAMPEVGTYDYTGKTGLYTFLVKPRRFPGMCQTLSRR